MNKLERWNIRTTLTGLFSVLTVGFMILMLNENTFFEWAFARHHNVLSWYIRPFILLPICYFAYKRNGLGVSASVFLGLTSMFWFPEPQFADEKIIEFLQMEKDYLTSGWNLTKVMISSLVPLTIYLLGLAFWKRNIKAGIMMIGLIAVLKSIWSLFAGGESGTSVILPASIGLILCVGIIIYVFRSEKHV